MIRLATSSQQTKRLAKELEATARNARKQFSIAVNTTAGRSKRQWAKEISKEITTKQKAIAATIRISRKANANTEKPQANLVQRKSGRVSLREFRAKQTKRGVAYTIARKGGRKTLKGAFIVNSLGGHVFTRFGEKQMVKSGRNAGQMKQRISKKYGPSPIAVTERNDIDDRVREFAKSDLLYQVGRRLRFLKLKATGVI